LPESGHLIADFGGIQAARADFTPDFKPQNACPPAAARLAAAASNLII